MSAPILVPLDGSAFAEQALPVATALAARRDAPLHLVSVYQPFVPIEATRAYDRRLDDERREELRGQLQARAESLAAAVPGGVTHADLEHTDVAAAIIAEGERVGASLVVAATHGRGGLQRAWLGSVADALIRRAPMPVLLVRPREEEGTEAPAPTAPFRRVLLPLDGSERAEQAIAPALSLAATEGAKVRLLRVVKVPPTRVDPEQTFWTPLERDAIEEQRAAAMTYLEDVRRTKVPASVDVDTSVVLHSSPATAIVTQAEAWGADLIAMSTRGLGGLERLVAGSVADKVYRAASVPTLVVRPSR